MASSFQYQSNHDRLSVCSETRTLRRGSKSQMCLLRILRIITTVPPVITTAGLPSNDSETKESLTENDTSDEDKRSVSDLNGGYLVLPETEESFAADGRTSYTTEVDGGAFNVNFEDSSFGGDQIDRGEKAEHENMVSESTHIKFEKTEESLTLLIEAAKLIFGEFKDNEKLNSESETGKRSISRGSELKKDRVEEENETEKRKLRERSCRWTAEGMGDDFEETPSSPVVRSKRGRTQVLPYKYRDSVLEPLTRLSRNRSSSILPVKRRERLKS